MRKPAVLLAGVVDIWRQLWEDSACREAFTILLPAADESFPDEKPDIAVVAGGPGRSREALHHLRRFREFEPACPVLLLVVGGSEELAVGALRLGACDYLRHPVSVPQFIEAVRRACAQPVRPCALRPALAPDEIVGASPAMAEARRRIARIAPTDSNVLITGETGTGKELTAELLHRHSSRAAKRFVCVNCAAIPDTLLESELFGHEKGAFTGAFSAREGKLRFADGGTVFLDEIGDMDLRAQAKILRAIERHSIQRLGGDRELPVNVRIIAASNRDLEGMMAQSSFRQDLYFRLNVARIHLPPLRERREDIPVLLEHFRSEMNERFPRRVEGFAPELLPLLVRYDWPGNARQLRNFLESLFIFAGHDKVSLADLPSEYQYLLSQTGMENERDRLLFALTSTEWNKAAAARKLRWSRMTLYRKLAKYRIGDRAAANG